MTVLVVGAPRSGTSWVARVLAATPGAALLNEPDNHEHVPYALRAKRRLTGRIYPLLAARDEAPAYERLWAAALGADDTPEPLAGVRRRLAARLLRSASSADRLQMIIGAKPAPAALLAVPERPPAALRVVVKSVQAQLALEWITARFPVEVVVVLREPLNILSSWKALGWIGTEGVLRELGGDAVAEVERRLELPRLAAHGPLEEAALLIGLLTAALQDAVRRHPEWHVERHEELCLEPVGRFGALAAALGLDWDDAAARLVAELDRPGEGYETSRVAGSLGDVWRRRLDDEEAHAARAIFDRLSLSPHEHA
jgi:hypothetical protein